LKGLISRMMLASSPKTFDGYKSATPESTICRIEEGFEKIGFSVDYYEYVAGDERTKIFSGGASLVGTNFTASGKGRTSVLSKASAVAELVERFSVSLYSLGARAPYWYAHDELEKRFIKYDYREDAIEDIYDSIPDRIDYHELVEYREKMTDEDVDLLKRDILSAPWLRYHCLTDGKYYNGPDYLISIINGTTGLAAGNTKEEAIAQALSEIFERYPYLEIVKKKINPPSINLESIDHPKIENYIDILSNLNIEVDVKDCTFGGKYPVMGVVFTNHNLDDCNNLYHKRMFRKIFKAGSHVDKDEALERCFTEYVQGKTNQAIMCTEDSQDRRRDDIFWKYVLEEDESNIKIPEDYYEILLSKSLYYGDMNFLDRSPDVVDYGDVSTFKSDDFVQDVNRLTSLASRLGKRVYVQDWTHPRLLFPVVRVLVPGLSDTTLQMRNSSDYIFLRNSSEQMYLHGRLYEYFNSDEWLNSREGIVGFLDVVEAALYQFPPFEMVINTLERKLSIHAIALSLCLVIGDYGRAYKYLVSIDPSDGDHNSLLSEFLRMHVEKVPPEELYSDLRSRYRPNDVAEMLRYLSKIRFSERIKIRNPFVPPCYYERRSDKSNGHCSYDQFIKKAMQSFFVT